MEQFLKPLYSIRNTEFLAFLMLKFCELSDPTVALESTVEEPLNDSGIFGRKFPSLPFFFFVSQR